MKSIFIIFALVLLLVFVFNSVSFAYSWKKDYRHDYYQKTPYGVWYYSYNEYFYRYMSDQFELDDIVYVDTYYLGPNWKYKKFKYLYDISVLFA